MNQVWHMMKKDARRLWPHVLLCAAAALVAYTMSLQVKPHSNEGFYFRGRLMWFIPCWLLWVSLFPAIVQSDSPNGTAEFWMTRPVGPGRLFCGKIILALIVGVLPVVGVHALFLLTQGFQLEYATKTAVYLLAPLVAMAAFSVFFASLTRTIWSFWSLVTAIWIGVCLNDLVFDSIGTVESTAPIAETILRARSILQPTFSSVAALALAAFHFRHRRRIVTVVEGALLGWLITAGTERWPWSLPWIHVDTTSIQALTWEAEPIQGEHHQWQGNKRVRALALRIISPPGEAVHFSTAEGKIAWSNGNSTVGESQLDTHTYVGRIAAIQVALGSDYVISRQSVDEDSSVRIPLNSPGDIHLGPTSYVGEVEGERVSFVLLGKTPLVKNARLARDGYKLTIDEIPGPRNLWRLNVRYQSPRYKEHDFTPSGVPLLVLVNSSRKEAWLLGSGIIASSVEFYLPGLTLYAAAWDFEGDQSHRGGRIAVDDAWLAGAQLWAFSELEGAPVRLHVAFSFPSLDTHDSIKGSQPSTVSEGFQPSPGN